jgi:hypothetical protein
VCSSDLEAMRFEGIEKPAKAMLRSAFIEEPEDLELSEDDDADTDGDRDDDAHGDPTDMNEAA